MDNEDSAASSGTAIAAAIDEKHAMHSREEVKQPMAGLSDQEKDIIEKQTSAPNLTVGYFSLFRYANGMDRLVMVGALVASIAAGAVMPLMTLVYGNFAGSFTSHSVGAVEAAKFQSQINQFTLYFIYLGTRYILMLLMSTNLHRYRILCNIIHQHHRLLLYRRTYHTTDSRALPPGYL
jgi:ATP-binding cassette subfamily B (MDR/TAP) protein 1